MAQSDATPDIGSLSLRRFVRNAKRLKPSILRVVSAGSRKTTVLVVEDDPELRSLYRTALTLAGYAVVATIDGVDALRHLESHSADLVILDMGLPCLRGDDVQREMSAHADTRGIPIVVVTGEETHVSNPSDYACVLRKPLDLHDLVAAVARCLSRER